MATQTKTTVREVVYNELLKNYCSPEFPPSDRMVDRLTEKIELTEPGTDEAAEAAVKVQQGIWMTFSGGGLASHVTKDIYDALGRTQDTRLLSFN